MRYVIVVMALLAGLTLGHAVTATPVPESLSDPTTQVWMKISYPAEIRPIVQDAFHRQYGGPDDATDAEKLDLVHSKVVEYVTTIVVADLVEHGEIAKGDSLTEKEKLLRQRINSLKGELNEHISVESGP